MTALEHLESRPHVHLVTAVVWRVLLLACMICVARPCRAQALDQDMAQPFVENPAGYVSPFTVDTGWTLRKIVAGGFVSGLFAGSMIDSYYAWWQKRESSFLFHEDGWFGEKNTGVDKLGHLFTSHFYFHTMYDALRWGGFDHNASLWGSAAVTFGFAVLVEVGDGTTTLGFDYQDLVYNTAGLVYGMLQRQYPVLNTFRVKWSYVPAEGYVFPPRFTEHYDAHTYWLAVRVNDFLPESLDRWWPDALQLAVGWSVRDHYTAWNHAPGTGEFVVGLDLDLGAWPVSQRELHLAQRIVNHFHVPMPAVTFSRGHTPSWHVLQLR